MSLRLSRIVFATLTFVAFMAYAPLVKGQANQPAQPPAQGQPDKPAPAKDQPPPPPKPGEDAPPKCDYTPEQLAELVASAAKVTQLSRGVLPGGARVDVELPIEFSADTVYCARLDHDPRPVTVVSAREGKETPEKPAFTVLTLQIPPVTRTWLQFWGAPRELSLVGFQPDKDKKWHSDKPQVGIRQIVKITNSFQSVLGALMVLLVAYFLAAGTMRQMRKKWSFSPVAITTGPNGRASLSKLQIFGFSLIVIYLLACFLLRFGMLTDLSTDILLLLGISAAGTVASKVAGAAKKRLSLENWSWLRNEEWLTTYEEGHSPSDQAPKALWSDLLKTDCEFDVYSFQLATVSIVVGLSLLTSDLTTLSSFSIPTNLLGLLGLSNVVYVGGKAVGPSVTELDDKVTAVRNAETDWLTQVAAAVAPADTAQAKLAAAKTGAPDKYIVYVAAAREAARMLKTVYGPTGTKFAREPITDDQVMPTLP